MPTVRKRDRPAPSRRPRHTALGLGTRASIYQAFETLDALLEATPTQVARTRLVGPKTLRALQAALERSGLHLAAEEAPS